MKIVDLYIWTMNIGRVFQILWIVNKYAFFELSDRSRSSFWARRRVVYNRYSIPERLRQTIEELGPTYVKFGQIMADRSDIVSEKFRIELKKLQSNARSFDTNTALAMIEREMGESIASVFKSFDLTPWTADVLESLDDDYLFTTTIRRMTLRIAYVVLLIGLFIGATILIVWDNDRRFGYFILYVSLLLILFLLIKWIFVKDS